MVTKVHGNKGVRKSRQHRERIATSCLAFWQRVRAALDDHQQRTGGHREPR